MSNKTTRQSVRRSQLLSDGRKAIAMIEHGATITDVLMVVSGSRARLYRAMARVDDGYVGNHDPLLL